MHIRIASDTSNFVVVAPCVMVAREVNLEIYGTTIEQRDDVELQDALRQMGALEAFYQSPQAQSQNLEIRVKYDDVAQIYFVDRLVAQSIEGPPGVTGERLRNIPLQRILQMGTRGAVSIHKSYQLESIAETDLANARRRGPSEEILWSVAAVYRASAIREDSPAFAVASAFEIQGRTATNWIRRARDRGMFEVLAPGTWIHGKY